jgi:hypothetical protein
MQRTTAEKLAGSKIFLVEDVVDVDLGGQAGSPKLEVIGGERVLPAITRRIDRCSFDPWTPSHHKDTTPEFKTLRQHLVLGPKAPLMVRRTRQRVSRVAANCRND